MFRQLYKKEGSSDLRRVDSGVLYHVVSDFGDILDSDERVKIYYDEKVRIGQGGQGKIFKVRVAFKPDPDSEEVQVKWCALKQRTEQKQEVTNSLHENLTRDDATTLTHKIIKYMGHVSHEGVHYALYPYCEMILNHKLRALYKRADLAPELYNVMVIQIMLDLLDAVDYMHENHIVHRDIKPENIAFHLGHWCLIDLDCATVADTTVSTSGENMGTYCYMHPACHLHPEYNTKTSNDLHALGNVLRVLTDPSFFEQMRRQDPISYAFGKAMAYEGERENPTQHIDLEILLQENRQNTLKECLNIIAQYLTKTTPDEQMNAKRLKVCFEDLLARAATPELLEKAQKEFLTMIDECDDEPKAACADSPSSLLFSPKSLARSPKSIHGSPRSPCLFQQRTVYGSGSSMNPLSVRFGSNE